MSVLEHVVLTIDPAQAEAYEAAFHEARPLIEGQHGCGGARLVRVLETPAGTCSSSSGRPSRTTWRAFAARPSSLGGVSSSTTSTSSPPRSSTRTDV